MNRAACAGRSANISFSLVVLFLPPLSFDWALGSHVTWSSESILTILTDASRSTAFLNESVHQCMPRQELEGNQEVVAERRNDTILVVKRCHIKPSPRSIRFQSSLSCLLLRRGLLPLTSGVLLSSHHLYHPIAPRILGRQNLIMTHPNMRYQTVSIVSMLLLASSEQSFAYVTGTNTLDASKVGSLTVPNVGIGTIAWSSNSLTRLENPDLDTLVESACNQNGGFFDTGERYGSHIKTAMGMGWGETETMISKMLKDADIKDDALRPVVATKFTPSPWRTTAKSVVEACEASRERLGVDSIDLYQIHMPDIVKPLRFLGKDETYDEEYWEGLAECYHRGLVKNVGVSNYGPTLVTKCHDALAKRDVPLASNQIAYSLIGRHNGAQQTVDRCNELGVKVLAYYPFAMGLLTGKYSSLSPEMATEDVVTSLSSSRRSKLELKDLQRYANGDGKEIQAGGISPLLRAMEAIASARDKTVAQVALNYIICKGALPIAGSRTADQVTDNLGALGWRLSEDEVTLLEHTADGLGINFDGAGFKKTSEKFVGYGMERWSLN